MDRIRILLFAFVAILTSTSTCFGDMQTDDEIRRGVVRFFVPRCGGGNVDDNDPPDPELAEFVAINGDTNRLARILAEIAQTNNAWYSEMAMWELEKYGTSEQLPFLYSCATNPIIGDRAVKAALRIDGVSSNSVATLQRYLCFTNVVTTKTVYEKAVACRDFLGALSESSASSDLKGSAILVVRGYASDISTGVSMIDTALVDADNTYRHSKRRLADLRAAYPRCFNEYQTNYVTNAINELVAYPEANLPD